MAELQPLIVFHSRHFARHLGIFNRICVKLLQLMSGVITHNSVEKQSLYINKWLSYGHLQCFTAAILSAILEFVIRFVSNFYKLCSVLFRAIEKKSTSLSQAVFLASTNAAYTQTHTHTHTHTHTDTHTHTQTHTRRQHKAKCNALHFA